MFCLVEADITAVRKSKPYVLFGRRPKFQSLELISHVIAIYIESKGAFFNGSKEADAHCKILKLYPTRIQKKARKTGGFAIHNYLGLFNYSN